MRSVIFLLAVVVLTAAPELRSQQPAPLPPPLPLPAAVVPAGHHAGACPAPCSTGCSTKVCVTEMKSTTKVVHGSVCKEYCQPYCVPDCIRRCFGLSTCGSGECGRLRHYNVLTKKVVPGCDVPVCRVKDLSAACPAPGAAPGTPNWLPPAGTPTPAEKPKSP